MKNKIIIGLMVVVASLTAFVVVMNKEMSAQEDSLEELKMAQMNYDNLKIAHDSMIASYDSILLEVRDSNNKLVEELKQEKKKYYEKSKKYKAELDSIDSLTQSESFKFLSERFRLD